ncbi:hypothetical protein JQX13_44020 [Archangium violaceum]|uniref:hypothetical protein n=1 Tax=Archangium violaceum TaxID=83451 RepID=UPI00193B6F3B|nr:hypothetical protein [Archangium violaceum]QRK06958.1 hypothetical protein JQX13_44020 [Archangium violaceum]
MKASGRWMCRWGGAALALALMLTSQVALAERVAVSTLEGDKSYRLRAQVTAALRKTRKVQVSPPAAWGMAAGKLGLKGPAMVGPEAMSRLAPKLKVDAVLTGSVVRDSFNARLVARDGRELWSGRYPLKKGLLPPQAAKKLALAVAEAMKAAKRAPPPPELPPTPPEPVAKAPPEPSPAPQVVQPAPEPPVVARAEPVPQASKEKPAPVAEEPLPRAPSASGTKLAARWVELDDESHTYTPEFAGSGGGFPLAEDAQAPEEGTSARGLFPPRARVLLGAAVTWRRYCARPGVASCAAYDALPEEQQVGDIADFNSNAPYAGLAVEAEVFPLSHWPSLLRGVGLTLGYHRGFARTTVTVSTPVGSTPEREVYATDTDYEAMLAYRYFFDLGNQGAPQWGYAGLRLGAHGREFDVDEAVESPLPVTHRFYPVVALDASVPLMRSVRIVGSGQFFLLPTPGHSLGGDEDGSLVAEVRDYGTSVSTLGWAAELGLAGDIWGPFGFSARFRLEHYVDRFEGQGTRRGWTAGGVAEDTFSSILAGVTASW